MQAKATKEVIPYLKRAGLYDNLDEVVVKSAIITHPRGNRRFHGYILNIKDGVVVGLHRLEPEVQSKTFIVWELCDCDGKNKSCALCNGTGEYKVTRNLK